MSRFDVDWKTCLPWVTTALLGGYVIYSIFGKKCSKCVNCSVEKDRDKVVHSFDIEDLGEKTAFCRCWKSKKFPHCDGSHNAHNEATGDNVGPVVVKKPS